MDVRFYSFFFISAMARRWRQGVLRAPLPLGRAKSRSSKAVKGAKWIKMVCGRPVKPLKPLKFRPSIGEVPRRVKWTRWQPGYYKTERICMESLSCYGIIKVLD